MLFRLKSVWEISNALLISHLLNEAPSSIQPECHGQEVKEGSTGERWSQCSEVPRDLVVMSRGERAVRVGSQREWDTSFKDGILEEFSSQVFPLSKMSEANLVVLPQI